LGKKGREKGLKRVFKPGFSKFPGGFGQKRFPGRKNFLGGEKGPGSEDLEVRRPVLKECV